MAPALTTMFEKVLVANRGEIAVRIIRTLKKMGIRTVAVYSEADTNALHVKEAHEAVYLGPAPSSQSYLVADRIIEAMLKTGAQAVHPGYGFLSENTDFARELQNHGLVLIGPSPTAILAMGDKIEAKKLAEEAGVNTIPGYMGAIKDAKEALKIAKKIGFPVMIKAAAGGGGKGMRVVYNEKDIAQAFSSATNEAKSSFKDGRIFIEKFIENPRHIEIQLLADKHGTYLCLGERECSIQRHHQKVIEEAPSPFLDEATRKKMYKQVISLAKKVGYYSAGTAEFIVDSKRHFYFLEMNTRLQVEHCVTEEITGYDIVEQMVRIAAGEKLSFTQKDVKLTGWAMESRIYAEDPSRSFLPSSGRINSYQEPEKSRNVRIDTGVYAGGEVSMFYDPMIAKLITYGENRDEAIEHMKKALSSYVIRGVSHNMSFLEAVMSNPRFVKGDLSTNFIAEEYPDGFSGAELTSEITQAFIGTAVFTYLKSAYRDATISGQLQGRQRQLANRWVVTLGDIHYPVIVKSRSKGYDIKLENQSFTIISSWDIGNRLFQATISGRPVSVKIEHRLGGLELTHSGSKVLAQVHTLRAAELLKFMPDSGSKKNQAKLRAPISGLVVAVKVEPGMKVNAGQELMIIEAMKMENVLFAEQDAEIKSILVKAGDSINAEDVVIEFKQ